MKINKSSAFSQAVTLTIASVILQILLFVYRIIITRFSGAGGMGIYQLAAPYYSILSSIALSGITMSVTRLTVEKNAVNDAPAVKTVVRRSLQLFLTLLAVSAAVTFIFPDFIAGKILGNIQTKACMLLFIPCLFFTGFENIYKSFFYGVKTVKPNIISEISELCIRIIAIFILLYMNQNSLTTEKTAFLIVFGMIISEIFSFTFLGLYYKRYNKKSVGMTLAVAREVTPARDFYPGDRKGRPYAKEQKSKNILSEIARIAVPISASSLLMTIITSVNTILLPQRLVASGMSQTQAVETLGMLMGMAFPLVTIPAIFIGPVINVMFPRITSAIKLGDKKDMNDKIAKVFQSCSFMTFPAMGVVAAIGGPLCVLMYKNETAGSYILPLVLSSVFIYIQMITGSILYALDQQKKLAAYNFIDGVIHIIFTYFFVAMPNINVYGFMLGHLTSSFVGTVLNTVTVVKYSKIKINFTKWFVLPAVSGIYTGFMAHFIHNFCVRMSFAPVVSVIISILFSVLIYISILQLRDISVVKYVKKLIRAKT